jgi:O-antigen ligase
MTYRQMLLWLIMWLTRVGAGVFVLGGLGFFVSAWQARSVGLVVMGVIAIAVGTFLISIRAAPGDRLEYGLFRRRRSAPSFPTDFNEQ